jgi:signal peptidase II
LKQRAWIAVSLILAVLLADQALKLHIKTSYVLETGSRILGSDKFRIHFTENEGMAFGLSFGGRNGKLFLTLFRIVAVGFIGYYLGQLCRRRASMGLVISIALVFAGAMGNIFDSVFYGVLFSASSVHGPAAQFLPEGGGYAPLFFGRVVDMFYFPVWTGHYPDWLLGGRRFTFFAPVFNLADAAITVGVLSVLLFHRGQFSRELSEAPDAEGVPPSAEGPDPEAVPVREDAG